MFYILVLSSFCDVTMYIYMVNVVFDGCSELHMISMLGEEFGLVIPLRGASVVTCFWELNVYVNPKMA